MNYLNEQISGKKIRCWIFIISFLLMGMLMIPVHQSIAAVPDNSRSIAAGNMHSLAVKPDGTVWAWGENIRGALGIGSTTNHSTPVQVTGLNSVTAVTAGASFSIALKADGTVWAWGWNEAGQVGDGSKTNRTLPIQVNGLSGIMAVEAGCWHSLALKSDGTVWAWGYNGNGQVGDGSTLDRATPVKVQGLDGIIAISGGTGHSLALKQDGTVWIWGDSFGGYGYPQRHLTPVKVEGLNGIIAISAGDNFSLALKSDGTVWAWGKNQSSQLGDGTNTDRITPAPLQGLIGVKALAAGLTQSAALKTDGSVYAWGSSGPIHLMGLSGVTAISSFSHSLVLKNDGSLWAWGCNLAGELGDGTTQDKVTPVRVLGPNGEGYLNLGTIPSPNNDNYPIIIIPGIMGSKLYSDDNCSDIVWSPFDDISTLVGLGSNISIDKNLHVSPCLKQNGPRYIPEYGVNNEYLTLVNRLIKDCSNREIYFFSYDWRKSNIDSSEKLKLAINDITYRLGVDKVDLVCHSMGGIVASLYASEPGNSNKINKIITLGTPYEGSPQTFSSLCSNNIGIDNVYYEKLRNSIIGGAVDSVEELLVQLTRSMKTNLPGALELVPNERYFSYNNWYEALPLYQYNHALKLLIDYDKYVSFNNSIFDETKYSSTTSVQDIIYKGANDLYLSGKSYYAIGTTKPTVTSVVFNKNTFVDYVDIIDVLFSPSGDGTVPYISGSRCNLLTSLGPDRFREFNLDHGGLVKDNNHNGSLDFVVSILNNTIDVNAYQKPSAHTYLKGMADCPVDVTISNGDSQLCSDPNNLNLSTDFGELIILGANSDIKVFALNNEIPYEIRINGTNEGTMNYSLQFYDEDNNLYDERIFTDIPLTGQTIITTGSDNSGEMILYIDKNGDGQAEDTWVSSGANAVGEEDDRIPPILNLPDDITVYATNQSGTQVTYMASAVDGVDGDITVVGSMQSGSVFPVGTNIVTCLATDANGNDAIGSFKITVKYDFEGFYEPINNINSPDIVIGVKAGSSIPVKFSLSGDMGLDVFAPNYPASKTASFSSTPVDLIEETVTDATSNNVLQYDPKTEQYIYVWKTDKAWAGTGRQLMLKFKDGTIWTSNFEFTK
ncbi:MAG: PxKF domain-containing protein [Syntrophomonadaceae bacterium]